MKLNMSNIKSHKLNTPYPTIEHGKPKTHQIGHDRHGIPQIEHSRP